MGRRGWTDRVVLADVQGSGISRCSIERDMGIQLTVGVLGHSVLHSFPAVYGILPLGSLVR